MCVCVGFFIIPTPAPCNNDILLHTTITVSLECPFPMPTPPPPPDLLLLLMLLLLDDYDVIGASAFFLVKL